MRVAPAVVLSDGERAELEALAAAPETSARLAQRARIVLLAADGLSNQDIGIQLGLGRAQVGNWRNRYAAHRLAGVLHDLPRGAPPARVDVERLTELTAGGLRPDGERWSTRAMAAELGVSPATISRHWRAQGLAPHDAGTLPTHEAPDVARPANPAAGANGPSHAPPELFIDHAGYEALSARANAAGRGLDTPTRLALAWHARQRDTPRALALVAELESDLQRVAPAEREGLRGRIALVRIEADWLFGRLEDIDERLEALIGTLEIAGDFVGQSDALRLRALVAHDAGRHEQRNASMRAASVVAGLAGDRLRSFVAEALCARFDSFASLGAAEAQWSTRIDELAADEREAVQSVVRQYRADIAFARSDYRGAAENYALAATLYARTGQRNARLLALGNAGVSLSNLNEPAMGLPLAAQALAEARSLGWPYATFVCLLLTANIQHALKAYETAAALLAEGEALWSGKSRSLAFCSLQHTYGKVLHSLGRLQDALQAFECQEAVADDLGSVQHRVFALTAQAEVLADLGRQRHAIAAAQTAVSLTSLVGNRLCEADALTTLAALHANDTGPAPAGSPWPDATLHYLHAALESLERIEGVRVNSDLLSRLARAHARTGMPVPTEDYERLAAEAAAREADASANDRLAALAIEEICRRAMALPG